VHPHIATIKVYVGAGGGDIISNGEQGDWWRGSNVILVTSMFMSRGRQGEEGYVVSKDVKRTQKEGNSDAGGVE
jgi:hypothetical protein